MIEHGPGVTWLAGRAGCTAAELLADPRRLVDALADAGRAVTGLALHLQSDDPAVRADAEREAERLRRLFEDGQTPGERFRAKVLGALRDATDRVRAAADDGGDGGESGDGRRGGADQPGDPMPPGQEPR